MTPTGKDSVDCRTYHATVALDSAGNAGLVMAHCSHANASGGEGVCGTGCDNYCDAMTKYCNGSNTKFNDVNTCLSACKQYPHDYSGTPAIPVSSGNSFECRKYHVIAASMGDTALHCGHADKDGGGVCVKSSAPEMKIWMLSVLLPILWLILSFY
jgi:hypothetical protein